MTKNQRLQIAAETIIPVVETLSRAEWVRLSGLIDYAYTAKAAKVVLDGSDVENLHRSIQVELLGRPYGSSTT